MIVSGTVSARGRVEDGPLLRGKGRFVSDLTRSDTLHLAVVRSPVASGRLARVDVTPALTLAGVVDAFAAADVAGLQEHPIPSRIPVPESVTSLFQPPLAACEVRYVGQPVAVVVAAHPRIAQDAAESVTVSIDERAEAPRRHVHTEAELVGNVEAAFAEADVVVRDLFAVGRQSGLPLEPRGILAHFSRESGTLDVWAAAKAPEHLRGVLAATLGLTEAQIRLRRVDAGGGFGVRGELHPEEILVPLASLRLARPVTWSESRAESFYASYQSRGQEWDAALAVRADGTILGLDGTLVSDLGAYVGPNGLTVGRIALKAFLGPYRVPAYRCRVEHIRTGKVPLGTARGPGYFEAGFVRERLLDMAARELGLDPIDVRRRNLVTSVDMPYSTGLAGVTYDGGDYSAVLDRALIEVERRSGPPGDALEGLGVSCTVEASGTPGIETVVATLEPSGRITISLASTSFGQGHASALAGIAATTIGVDAGMIDIDEAAIDSGAAGAGTFASRTMMTAGNACLAAAAALREAIVAKASEHLGGPVDICGGRVEERPHGAGLDLREIAPITSVGTFETTASTFTFGAGAARVAVDPETGAVRLLDLVVAADVGHAVDPQGARAQLMGGAVHGVGGALFELIEHDPDGDPRTVSLRDYHVPVIGDLPEVKVILLEDAPAPGNPLGARGVGEIATGAAAAAIANAVASAVAPLGLTVTRLPIPRGQLVAKDQTFHDRSA